MAPTIGLYKTRKDAGLCVGCSKLLTPENRHNKSVVCKHCRKNRLNYIKERRAKFILAGKCRCGAKPVKGTRSCKKCITRDRASRARLREAKNDE